MALTTNTGIYVYLCIVLYLRYVKDDLLFIEGLINDLLGAKVWLPLSRINYMAYLIHNNVVYVLSANMEAPVHFTGFTFVCILIRYTLGAS